MNPDMEAAVVDSRDLARPGTQFARWHRRVLAFCLIIFSLEIGLFLVAFPWTFWWELNWIPVHSPDWTGLWMSGYFRGAVSGLGLLDLYVALRELYVQLKAAFRTSK